MSSRPSIQRFAVSLERLIPVQKRNKFYKAMMAVPLGLPFQSCVTRIAELLEHYPLTLLMMNQFTTIYDGFYTIENNNVFYTNRVGVKKSLPTLQLENARTLRHLDRLRYAHEWKSIDVEIEDSGDEELSDEDTDSEDEEEEYDGYDYSIPRLGVEDSDDEEPEEPDGEEIQPEFPIRYL